MSWVQIVLAVPAAFLVFALVHDFFAGLADERIWNDPATEDPAKY